MRKLEDQRSKKGLGQRHIIKNLIAELIASPYLQAKITHYKINNLQTLFNSITLAPQSWLFNKIFCGDGNFMF